MGCYNDPPYYISAYSLAVRRGFEGTLDEWLESLRGDRTELRYQAGKVQYRWVGATESEWMDLFDIGEVLGEDFDGGYVDEEGYLHITKDGVELDSVDPISLKTAWITVTSSQDAKDLGKKIAKRSTVFFAPGNYHIDPIDLEGLDHVTFQLGSATVICTGAYFLKASGCDHLRIEGGRIEGTAQTEVGVELYDCRSFRAVRMCVANIGREHTIGAKGIQITGDCSGFLLDQCDISDIHSGQVSDPETDDWIHAYGVIVNRAESTEKYSKSGVIRSCAFRRVAGNDQMDDSGAVTKQADGDGVFIHQFPYYDADGKLARTDPNILIEGCSFEGCKKRGVKANSRGVTVRRCRFEGDFWLGPVEFQQGYGLIEDCYLVNTTQQTGGSVAGIVLDEGGVTIRDCFISCPYSGGYHDGIVMDGRIGTNPVAVSEPWDLITVERCRFDGVSRALVAGAGSGGATGYHLRGIHVVDCRFGLVTGNYPVHISKGRFGSIDSLRMVDYRFDYGQTKGAVNAKIGELTGTTGEFKYPILYGLVPTGQLHLWSAYYLDSPTVSYGNSLPVDGAAPDTRIVYYNLGNIKYAERNAWQTRYWGPIQTDPAKLTASQTVDMLKAARPGDVFTSTATGDVYICTVAGTAGSDGVEASSGTWAKVSATVVSATEVT